MQRLYVVTKFILASSAREAMQMEKKKPVDECYINNKWFENSNEFHEYLDGKQK